MESTNTEIVVLSGETDRFKGITVDCSNYLDLTSQEFNQRVTASLSVWIRDQTYRSVWCKVPKGRTEWMPLLIDNGFELHHAKPSHVMLYKWICCDEEDVVPQYAFHYIGVGGFVINQLGNVLVIQEKYKAGNRVMWKLPGGLAEPGEDIGSVARREVLEETGVGASFDSILGFRHMHGYVYGCSDIYFVCVMRAECDRINMNAKEIDKCRWMKVEDYINSEGISDANRYFAELYRDKYLSSSHQEGADHVTCQCDCMQRLMIKGERVQNFNRTGNNVIYSVQSGVYT